MISQMYEKCFSEKKENVIVPNSLIQNFELKKELHVVYKENKAWIFDYDNSVLYTMTQIGALFIYAFTKGHSYKEIVAAISKTYGISTYIVDSDLQSFLSEMLRNKLIKLAS